MSLHAAIAGVAVWGPGLEGWDTARAVLRREAPFVARETPVPVPAILPANERRRSGVVVRLALEVAQRATAMAGVTPASLRCVFGSANGDGAVVHALLETLASAAAAEVSPTLFHNSVHNAAAGYWTIAVGSRQAATCLGCHDATFAAALLKAAAEMRAEAAPVLLCVYDAPLPWPLGARRVTEHRFAAAFVLVLDTAGALATIELDHGPDRAPDTAIEPRLAALRALCRSNPAARALRLLEAIACERADRFAADYLDGCLTIAVQPCSTATAS